MAVQTFGDFQNFTPHLHIIATDGCFYGQGQFLKTNQPCPADLEPLFRQEVFKLRKTHGLSGRIIDNMMGWHHSGFNVYCGPAIWPGNDTGIENLARYIIRAAFSQERMQYSRHHFEKNADAAKKGVGGQETGGYAGAAYLDSGPGFAELARSG